MKQLIDDLKITASFYSRYSGVLYTSYESAIEFAAYAGAYSLTILFSQVKNTDEIMGSVTIDYNEDTDEVRSLAVPIEHMDAAFVNLSTVDINSAYTTLVGIQLITRPTAAVLLEELVSKSRSIIQSFIDEVTDAKFIRSTYQQPRQEMLKVTPESIDALIRDSHVEYAYFDNTLTMAIVKLPSGFKEVGQSSCSDPADFNKAIGQQKSLANARAKLWEHETYHLAKLRYDKIRCSYQGSQ